MERSGEHTWSARSSTVECRSPGAPAARLVCVLTRSVPVMCSAVHTAMPRFMTAMKPEAAVAGVTVAPHPEGGLCGAVHVEPTLGGLQRRRPSETRPAHKWLQIPGNPTLMTPRAGIHCTEGQRTHNFAIDGSLRPGETAAGIALPRRYADTEKVTSNAITPIGSPRRQSPVPRRLSPCRGNSVLSLKRSSSGSWTPRSFRQSFHPALLHRIRPVWPESGPNLTRLDLTGPVRADDGQLSPKQRRFDDETRVAVFPARLRTTSIGATTSELE
jgi:hypothetical protein